MKLLYILEHISVAGGLERILIDKMNALAHEEGYEVHLMTVWKENLKPAFPLDERVGQVCLNVPLPTTKIEMMMAMPKVLCRYNRKVREIAPDVVVHFRAIGAMLAAFSSWKGYTVFESHGARMHNNHLWLYPWMERRVDSVVCLTNKDAENYATARHVEVIPNFTTIPPATPNYDVKRCVFVGRLCYEKNPQRLIRLWERIVRIHSDWHLDIYGDGDMFEQVVLEVDRRGMGKSVTLHGNVDDIRIAYANASIALLTSRTEGLPMSIIEAMRSGLPVVSTDCPYGPAELIRDGENGRLVALEDDEAFVDAVSSLMDNRAMREQMGHMAHKTSDRYSKAAIIKRWKKFFQEK